MPIPLGPDEYPVLTSEQRANGEKYEKPVSDAYLEIYFMNGKYQVVHARDTCGAPEVTTSGVSIRWHLSEELDPGKRRHALEIIPMERVKSLISFPASEAFNEALDRWSYQQTGMAYDEVTELAKASERGAELDHLLSVLGINPDDVTGFSG